MAKKSAKQKELPSNLEQGMQLMGWALYQKSTSTILKRRQATPGTADGSLPVGLDPDLAWLVEQEQAQPQFDANTHRLERGETIAVDQNDSRTGTLTTTWTAVALPQSEINRRKDDAIAAGMHSQVKTIAGKLKNAEAVTVEELAEVVKFMAIRDGLQFDEGV